MIWLVLWRYQFESLQGSSSYDLGVFVVSFNPVDKGVIWMVYGIQLEMWSRKKTVFCRSFHRPCTKCEPKKSSRRCLLTKCLWPLEDWVLCRKWFLYRICVIHYKCCILCNLLGAHNIFSYDIAHSTVTFILLWYRYTVLTLWRLWDCAEHYF